MIRIVGQNGGNVNQDFLGVFELSYYYKASNRGAAYTGAHGGYGRTGYGHKGGIRGGYADRSGHKQPEP